MSIVKNSKEIFKALSKRKKELKLSLIDICNDAELHGKKIPYPSLSKYFSESSDGNNLPEESILFLCCRYGIDVDLIVGVPSSEFDVSIPDYNEKDCIKNIKKKYPKQ
jgi:hypothetical protein